MAEPKVLVVTNNQLDHAEKSLNKLIGRYFPVTNEVMDGDDILSVIVDHDDIAKEDDGSNWPDVGVPTGKKIINATKLLRNYNELSPENKAIIDGRFGSNIQTWIEANWLDKSAVKFYKPL